MRYLRSYTVTVKRGRKWGYGKLTFNVKALTAVQAKIKAMILVALPDGDDHYNARLKRA